MQCNAVALFQLICNQPEIFAEIFDVEVDSRILGFWPQHIVTWMIMFGFLPHHLIQVVLDDYVGSNLSTISHLDVACCSGALRQDLLAVIPLLRKLTTDRHWLDDDKHKHLSNLLCWMASRRCHVSSLDVDPMYLPDALTALPAGGISLPHTTSVAFFSHNTCCNTQVSSIVPFLAMLPDLTDITFRGWPLLSDGHLRALCNLQCPLEALNLLNCNMLSAGCVVEVVSRFHLTMKRLMCETLNDSALLQLALLRLPKLQHLHINCVFLKSSAALGQFCESISDTLESLTLSFTFLASSSPQQDLTSPISNSTIKMVTRCCHQLKIIEFRSEGNVDLHCLPDVMAGCPHIERLYFPSSTTIEFVDGKPAVCGILCLDDAQKGLRRCADFAALGVAVRGVHVSFQSVSKCAECIRYVADHFGHELAEFSGRFEEDDDVLVYLLSRCPNLVHLDLGMACKISDKSFALISVCCPKLVRLALGYSHLVTATTVMKVLQQFHANGSAMKVIQFRQCDQLQKDMVMAIQELFPAAHVSVEHFNIMEEVTEQDYEDLL